MKVIYESFDGQYFDNEEDCKTYEEGLCPPQLVKRVKQVVEELKAYCSDVANTMECENCPFYTICEIPVPDWKM